MSELDNACNLGPDAASRLQLIQGLLFFHTRNSVVGMQLGGRGVVTSAVLLVLDALAVIKPYREGISTGIDIAQLGKERLALCDLPLLPIKEMQTGLYSMVLVTRDL
ncbi:hypothetical protein VPNG_04456 [Cytospora leucostoma]|uniref:Uncharacterized protein n=1 Tax=Cytospora leucostoma TaxID=1230097 RepID=A0A423XBY2_9PEZI|nr:hypothetical protein VPNG_04456 [Cytospora leucostoma]